MPDLIPEGCISLRSAFDRFALWGGQPPIEILWNVDLSDVPHNTVAQNAHGWLSNTMDTMLADFRRVFSTGALDALIRAPGAHENSAVPADSWSSAFNPERSFLSDIVVAGNGGYWEGIVGRTPFVRLSQFNPWQETQIVRRADPEIAPSPSAGAVRDHLIGLAQNGLATSKQVEAWAASWGMPPLANAPPRGKHDPLKVAAWTMAMAATWILSRDLAQVREAMDGYRAECWYWGPYSQSLAADGGRVWYEIRGEQLETLNPLSLLQMGTLEAFDESPVSDVPVRTVRSAREALWRCLANGRIAAGGINVERQVVAIPAHEWPYLQLAGSLDGAERLGTDPASRTSYTDITILQAAILDIWPHEAKAHASPNGGVEVTAPASRKIRPARKFEAVEQAFIKLYGAVSQVPDDLTNDELHEAIVTELRQKKPKADVSRSTIERVRKKG